jgi:hypothetical protein
MAACRDPAGAATGNPSASAAVSSEAARPSPEEEGTEEELETVDDTPGSGPDDGDEDAGVLEDGGIDHESACAPVDPGLKPMQLLKFTFADGVDGRDPRRRLEVARAGQRVFAHLTLRNRSGRARCVHMVFRVGGKKRTEVTLKIGESWSWRTYAYNTLRSDDNKPLELVVTDDQGATIVREQLAVVPPR